MSGHEVDVPRLRLMRKAIVLFAPPIISFLPAFLVVEVETAPSPSPRTLLAILVKLGSWLLEVERPGKHLSAQGQLGGERHWGWEWT